LCDAKWTIFHPRHGENKLHFDVMKMTMMSTLNFCTRPTRGVGFFSARSLKYHSAGKAVAPLGHII
jgi:hypothetical protein